MEAEKEQSCIMVIFGGTGDLTHRKLLPAIYDLEHEGRLPEEFAITAVGRRKKTTEEYRADANISIGKFARYSLKEDIWGKFSSRIHYFRTEFSEDEGYKALKEFLMKLDESCGTKGNRLFYLAVSPENYELIVGKLSENGLADSKEVPWKRLVIEKPFGRNLETSRQLNRRINDVFPEENTFRIDHYLGKEMVQSILGIRFANAIFEPLWNNSSIDSIQISSSETIGIEGRGDYYEKTGALGDMVQNHLLQILALVAMEPPANMKPESIRTAKTKLLQSIMETSFEVDVNNMVFGQYAGCRVNDAEIISYRQEAKVDPDSNTETFVALKLEIDNPRWKGTPIYIRTGKRMPVKSTEVVIQFKPQSGSIFPGDATGPEPNLLVIKIQPREEIYIQFNTKDPGIEGKICPVRMNFCQNCKVCEARNCSPEAYEKLVFDAIKGDSTLFTRWDEVEQSWMIIDKINEIKKKTSLSFPNYLPNSWGPAEADWLLAKDGRHWWNPEED